MNTKVDFKKILKSFYAPPNIGFHVVDVPVMNFLMIDGKGDPNKSAEYQQSVEALYTMSYGLKFAYKPQGYDHIVPPLEGLWWTENMSEFTLANKHAWEWRMMIMQPEWIATDMVEKVRVEAIKKKGLPLLKNVRFEVYNEGLSVQILYFGAYDLEASTIAEMHKFIHSDGYQPNGKHHEIYLGDPRKTAAEKLQTVLRQPIRQA